MTARINWRSAGLLLLPSIGLAGLAGCTSSMPEVAALDSRSSAPLDTGRYPNLNIPPPVAAKQFTDEERDAKTASLKAIAARRRAGGGGGGPTARTEADLAKLGKTHGDDVLKQIQSE